MHQNLQQILIDAWQQQQSLQPRNNISITQQNQHSAVKFKKIVCAPFHTIDPSSSLSKRKNLEMLATQKKRTKSVSYERSYTPSQYMDENRQFISSQKQSRFRQYPNINTRNDSRVFTRPPIKTTYYSCVGQDLPKYKKPSLRQLLKNKTKKTTYCNAHTELQKGFHFKKNTIQQTEPISNNFAQNFKKRIKDKKKSISYKLLQKSKNQIDLSLDNVKSETQMQFKAYIKRACSSNFEDTNLFQRINSPPKSGKFHKNQRKYIKNTKNISNPILEVRGCKAN